jgi:hypothetical protein
MFVELGLLEEKRRRHGGEERRAHAGKYKREKETEENFVVVQRIKDELGEQRKKAEESKRLRTHIDVFCPKVRADDD